MNMMILKIIKILFLSQRFFKLSYNVSWLCEDFRLSMRNLSVKPKAQQVQTKN